MRKITTSIITALLCIFLLNACKKSFNEQVSVPIPTETPDLSAQILQSVSGFVNNENGSPVINATVTAGSKSTTTDQDGHFVINDVRLSKTAGFIKISYAGYFEGYRTFVGIANQETFVRVQLVPKTEVGIISASAGGSVTTADGAIVQLPANAVVVAANNTTYSGNIHIAAHLYNQSDIAQWNKMMPGDQRGTDSAAKLKILKSYGMLAVELTGDAGELLQIAAGKEATITTPIPSALLAEAPASIILWSFDVTNGLWKQEGTTTKTGNTYTGNVQHFSFWTGANAAPVVNITAQIVNNSAQTIGNVFICVRRADDPNIGTSAFTNSLGSLSTSVLANTDLVLQVYSFCGGTSLVYSQNFTTSDTDVNFGTITAALGDQLNITGTALNCNNASVTDGYVILMIANVTYHLPIINGTFTFSTATCADLNTDYVVVDYGAGQQSALQNIVLTAGTNDLGTTVACGTSSVAFLDYSIDNAPTIHLTEPRDTQKFVSAFTGGDETSIVTLDRDGNPLPNMAFTFTGGTAVGPAHTASYFQSRNFPTGTANTNPPYQPIPVTITEYGARGGFVAGHFEGDVQDQNDGSNHHVMCTWRVRRTGL